MTPKEVFLPKCPHCGKEMDGLESEAIERSKFSVILTKDGLWEDYSDSSETLMELYRCPNCKAALTTSADEALEILKGGGI
jgi:predicted RNA-binding Zn-ribbon protein involved in translation (DUF1610 family)